MTPHRQPATRQPVTAIVPLRDGISGKSRLAVLDSASRSRLVAALARHVVDVLVTVPAIDRVILVTADATFAQLALGPLTAPDYPVEVVAQLAERPGLNAALDLARQHVLETNPDGPRRLVIVHADLPALTQEDVEAVLAPKVDVVLATDRARLGTNVLVIDADQPFAFRFGEDSLHTHLDEAARRRLSAYVVRREGTGVDLDTLIDWAHLPDEVRARVSWDVRMLRLSGASPDA